MRCIWIAAYALLATAPVCAQTQYEPAMPRGITDSAVPQSRELSAPPSAAGAAPAPQVVEPRVPRLVTTNDRHVKDADARRCLQFTSNRDIHRCANRYLPREARAKLTRTKAAAKTTAEPAAAAAPRSKAAADIGKADLSKAAPAAKPVETAKIVPSPSPAAEKPSATPKAAPPQQAAAPSGEKPPKWTDGAKAVVKKQGERLPD